MWDDEEVYIEVLKEFVERQERRPFRLKRQRKVSVWFAEYEGPRLVVLTKAECEECGDKFAVPQTGRPKRFCSDNCQLANWRSRKRTT